MSETTELKESYTYEELETKNSRSYINTEGSLQLNEFINNGSLENASINDVDILVESYDILKDVANKEDYEEYYFEEIIKTIPIFDEQFHIEQENSCIYLTHPKWSLVGCGETLIDAENDLIREAIDLFPYIMSNSYDSFDEDGKNLYDFLIKVDSQCRSLVEK